MPFKIIRNDLTKMHADAIVNTANPRPVVGSGTDYAIYSAAGWDKLLAEREKIGWIERGQAAITPAFRLNAKYIIHTVGPKWIDGNHNEEALLRSCYENSLRLAREYGCGSIAFPMISTGNYGFPKDTALQIVLSVVSKFLSQVDMDIYLVVFDEHSTRLSEKLFERIESRIDDHYVKKQSGIEYFRDLFRRRRTGKSEEAFSHENVDTTQIFPSARPDEDYSSVAPSLSSASYGYVTHEADESIDMEMDESWDDGWDDSWDASDAEFSSSEDDTEDLSSVFAQFGYSVNANKKNEDVKPSASYSSMQSTGQLPPMPGSKPSMWKESAAPKKVSSKKKFTKDSDFMSRLLGQQTETFQEMLFRLMEEKYFTGPELYKKANISKKLFSKIKNTPDYQPSKKTIFALALALELNLDQAIDLLSRAGYAFSPTSPLDKIIRCCFEEKFYNLYDIEALLFDVLEDTLTA